MGLRMESPGETPRSAGEAGAGGGLLALASESRI